MTEAILALPPHLRKRLTEALAAGSLQVPCQPSSLRASYGLGDEAEAVAAAIGKLVSLGLSGEGCAEWIRSLNAAVERTQRPDLVWSGPEVPGVHARDTRRVLDELLTSAERSLWLSTYAFFDGPKAFDILAKRLDARSDLQVTVLLNIQRKRGDTSALDQVVRRFTDAFWTKDWPGNTRPRVFYDPRSLDLDGPAGVLHAKAVVADDEVVLITSANLTEAALDRNIELGLLVRDRTLALSVVSHFRALIEQRLLSPLPAT